MADILLLVVLVLRWFQKLSGDLQEPNMQPEAEEELEYLLVDRPQLAALAEFMEEGTAVLKAQEAPQSLTPVLVAAVAADRLGRYITAAPAALAS